MSGINNFPLLIILLLFISAFTMPLIKKNTLVKGISLSVMGLSNILAFFTWTFVKSNGPFFYRVGHWDAPWGIEFRIGYIESIMAMVFTFVATVVIWYSVYSIEKEIKRSKVAFYYLLINILVGSLLGMVFSNDIFNCFVFIEVTTLASCGIIVVKDKKENIAATLKYLILSSLGSGLVLMGIAFLYAVTGNLNMTYIHKEIIKVYGIYKNTLLIASGLFTVGIGIKSAMFPLHIWLPDAHSSAPSSSSAILSSLVLKSPVLLLIKILYNVFGGEIIHEFFNTKFDFNIRRFGHDYGFCFCYASKGNKTCHCLF
ncbi:hypothetical protein FQB35_14760 [Crassaminicella thermophila]|uniref:NADH:quinone oxidoreductase/Mrp antiporter transmembrane domain-containing protein n=1 Tax=Crassaminicella thermophila TaxID=2599308 RepID=A0A5C0SHG1_CRATE|nr:proton-conducting transporter membrane subunit [Crassaminicella thermophila]QEK13422.1 hypothetical protein FQB35_14760 [Crassaminicella thermophila]